jgi:hypothetical protein
MKKTSKTPAKPGLDPATRSLIDGFHKSWEGAIQKDRAELDAMPKTHDPSKGEFVREVDPALGDK